MQLFTSNKFKNALFSDANSGTAEEEQGDKDDDDDEEENDAVEFTTPDVDVTHPTVSPR